MADAPTLSDGWNKALAAEFKKPYYEDLTKFVEGERKAHKVFPPDDEVFAALNVTPYEDVKVVILGQDPYHDDGQAHGMCFSVKPGIGVPPSLVNMYKELKEDLGIPIPKTGYLMPWAKQGVLLLNAVLTVRAHTPNSHKDKGWEQFTDGVIRALSARPDPMVFILWGKYAQKKKKLIDTKRHVVIEGAHPSPLSAKAGFFGSKPYSTINAALKTLGKAPIDWNVPNP